MPTQSSRLAALALSLGIALVPVLASADPGHNDQHGGGPGGDFHGGGPGGHGGHGGPMPRGHMGPPRGGHDWHKGDRFDGGGSYVDDWHSYHGLYAPPSGYRWVDYNGSYLLTAIATGVIANVIRY